MGNAIELRGLIKTLLNTNVADAYGANDTRTGNQFYDEADGINFGRPKTFPKGYIEISDRKLVSKSNLGRTGHVMQSATIAINYYAKEKNKYTVDGVTYEDRDLVNYQLDQIKNAILGNYIGGDYHLYPESIVHSEGIEKMTNGTMMLYYGVINVTYYWDDVI